jgi:hypothetical protein
MRIVLEWLGGVGPDRTRREPVAVPAWAPFAAAGALAGGIAAIAALLSSLIRVLAG